MSRIRASAVAIGLYLGVVWKLEGTYEAQRAEARAWKAESGVRFLEWGQSTLSPPATWSGSALVWECFRNKLNHFLFINYVRHLHTHERSTRVFVFSEVPNVNYYRTAEVGQTVKFPCPTKPNEDVNWFYLATRTSPDQFIYFGKHFHWREHQRFTVLDKNHSHSLVIFNVTLDDSAYYRCDEHSGFGRKRYYGLTVEG